MRTTSRIPAILASAALAGMSAPGAVLAEEDAEALDLARPKSSIEAGVGQVAQSNQRFGQYTGMQRDGFYGLLDLYLSSRDEATGRWLTVTGRNLGLSSKEFRLDHSRQGDWGYFLEYNEIPRYSPYVVNTGLRGIGTNTQTISPLNRVDYQLKTQRDAFTFGFDKMLWNDWTFGLRFRNEEKDGSRLFGRGSDGQEFLAEPINQLIRQLEATVGYAGKRLQLTGGYYGTWFTNRNTQLNVFGGTNSSAAAPANNFQTIALPPDNRSYQFNVAGGYNITPTTRATFKAASGRLLQTDTFAQGFFVSGAVPSTVPLAPGVPSNLGGRIDTSLYQVGLTTRLLPKLTLRADLRYENRADKTPIYTYLTGTGAASNNNGENEPRSIKSTNGKVEASYAMPMGFRLTGGVDYEQRERNASAVRIVSTRLKTEETSYRAELRRSLSETLNGSLGFVHSDRGGSDWVITTLKGGAISSNLMYPMFLADRKRDKVRGVLDWAPTEALSLNLVMEQARDTYTSRYVGLQNGKGSVYSLDASYQIAENWQATGWISRNDTRSSMLDCRAANGGTIPTSSTFCPNTAANETWQADLRDIGDAYGVGLRGKASAALDLGADLQYFRDRAHEAVTVLSPGAAAAPAIPVIHTSRITLRLTGRYALDKVSGIRVMYTRDHFKTDDWTWSTYVYGQTPNPSATDGTTLRQAPTQNVDFIGVSYYYGFR